MNTSAVLYPPMSSHRPHRKRLQTAEPPPYPPPQSIRNGANRVNFQQASPEVISSLITSLSAISSQAEHHFEGLTADEDVGKYTGLNPALSRTYYGRGAKEENGGYQQGFGVDYGAYKGSQLEESPDSYFPDAAIPPVVRMAKPKAPSTTTTSSRKLSLRRSTSSLRSARSRESLAPSDSFGAEPPPAISPGKAANSPNRARRLLRRASRDTMNSLETQEQQDHKSHGYLGEELVMAATNGRSVRRAASSRSLVADRIDEAIKETESPMKWNEQDNNDRSSVITPGSQFSASGSTGSPGGIGSGRPIPSRQSSLRHSFSGSPAITKRVARHSRHSMSGSKDIKVDSDLLEEENDVVRRIRELKVAKQKRDEEFEAVAEDITRRTRQRKSKPTPVPTDRSDSRHDLRRSVGGLSATDEAIVEEGAPSPTILTGKRRNQQGVDPLAATNIKPQSHRRTKSWERNSSIKNKRNSRQSSPQRNGSVRESRRGSGTFSPPRTSTGEGRPSTSDSIDDAVDAYLSAPRLLQKVKHPQSGRVITFSEVGDPNGFVVFCCVGMGLTRYLTAFYDELARTLKLRLITPDRPGVGESEPCVDGSGTPLAWPDDVAIICSHLNIAKFSLLAHSAGAIYALATALRMPQQIRGRIHLLAPWIPPSQMSSMGSNREPLPSGAVPYSQRILRALPTSFLKAANSSFMSATSASITSSLPRSPRNKSSKRRSTISADFPTSTITASTTPSKRTTAATADTLPTFDKENMNPATSLFKAVSNDPSVILDPDQNSTDQRAMLEEALRARERDYDDRLTHTIWHLATTNSNPALDLVTCLERRRPIGFRYVDITRPVVIHHGSRDTRVPVDNVRWLGRVMRRCEVRILDGQGHGLMAVPSVMGDILGEISKEWEDWTRITGKGERGRDLPAANRRGGGGTASGGMAGSHPTLRERAESLVSRHHY